MTNDLWIFAYGSLMWNPGFEAVEVVRGRADGFMRGFLMRSIHYRGTAATPGLVLALDMCAGASCEGMALRVAPEKRDEVIGYLRARELISYAYYEHVCGLTLADGRQVAAVTYVVDRDNDQYAGVLTLADQAKIIAGATGSAGPNRDYLYSTVASLRRAEIDAEDLFELETQVRNMCLSQK